MNGNININNNIEIGNRLRKLLEINNMTQAELAKKMDTTTATLSRYVTGKRQPKGEIVAKMAYLLNTTSDYILTGNEDNKVIKIENKTNEIVLSKNEQILLDDYRLLNTDGQKEANKRVKELTAIPFYRTNETVTIAAHSDKPIDNDEMDKIHKDLEDMMKW